MREDDTSFCELVHDAQLGNRKAREALLKRLQPELEKLAWFIPMSPEDSIQSLRLAVLELLLTRLPHEKEGEG